MIVETNDYCCSRISLISSPSVDMIGYDSVYVVFCSGGFVKSAIFSGERVDTMFQIGTTYMINNDRFSIGINIVRIVRKIVAVFPRTASL